MMIQFRPQRRVITSKLHEFDRLFKQEQDITRKLFLCKFSVLEVGGWTEEQEDEIVLEVAKNSLPQSDFASFEKDIVRKNSGFQYEHIKKMLIHAIGLSGVRNMENKMPPHALARLQSELNKLYVLRCSFAHTSLDPSGGLGPNTPAPSSTIGMLNCIYAGLYEVCRCT